MGIIEVADKCHYHCCRSLAERARISTLIVQNVPIRELKSEKKTRSAFVDMERRAKIVFQRAINRINVGNRL